jgi:predicted ArsR family transcriptional regulator
VKDEDILSLLTEPLTLVELHAAYVAAHGKVSTKALRHQVAHLVDIGLVLRDVEAPSGRGRPAFTYQTCR